MIRPLNNERTRRSTNVDAGNRFVIVAMELIPYTHDVNWIFYRLFCVKGNAGLKLPCFATTIS